MSQTDRDIEKLRLLGDVAWKENVGSLIKLCFLAADDEALFAHRVDVLWRSLPRAIKDSEEFQARIDACTWQPDPVWVYRYFCNVPMGTPEEPVAGSPYLAEQEPICDWKGVFEIVIDELESLGQTWKKDEGSVTV